MPTDMTTENIRYVETIKIITKKQQSETVPYFTQTTCFYMLFSNVLLHAHGSSTVKHNASYEKDLR